MNDRMKIAAMAMQGMLAMIGGGGSDQDLAERAVAKADALLAALAATEDTVAEMQRTDPGKAQDEVGDWRKYTHRRHSHDIMLVAAGDFGLTWTVFDWWNSPQGNNFWRDVHNGKASPADVARAKDFAQRVLVAMAEADE